MTILTEVTTMIISHDDIPKITVKVQSALRDISKGFEQTKKLIDVGEDFHPLVLRAYTIGNKVFMEISIR